MEFDPEPRRAPVEPFVPMINVVFLLLIFFLMTAEITPPAPFETEPPVADAGGAPDSEMTLHLSPEGAFAFADVTGAAALAEARAAAGEVAPLRLRADAGMAAGELASAMTRLAAAGVSRVELVTEPR